MVILYENFLLNDRFLKGRNYAVMCIVFKYFTTKKNYKGNFKGYFHNILLQKNMYFFSWYFQIFEKKLFKKSPRNLEIGLDLKK